MKLKDLDILEMMDFFEEALNRGARLDKQRKIQLRRKIRNELYSLLAWDLATPEAIMSRWEDRLYDVFVVLPYGFKDDLFKLLVEKLRVPLYRQKRTEAGTSPQPPSGTSRK
jgi:hypothetical protein